MMTRTLGLAVVLACMAWSCTNNDGKSTTTEATATTASPSVAVSSTKAPEVSILTRMGPLVSHEVSPSARRDLVPYAAPFCRVVFRPPTLGLRRGRYDSPSITKS